MPQVYLRTIDCSRDKKLKGGLALGILDRRLEGKTGQGLSSFFLSWNILGGLLKRGTNR